MMQRALVIGIGNEFRRDDGVGIAVARALKSSVPAGVEVCERCGEGTDLIGSWVDNDVVVVIDAVSSGEPAGTIHRFDVAAETATGGVVRDPAGVLPPAGIFRGTSHRIGLGEGIALARQLDMLPPRLIVYGVEGAAFGDGVELSPPVEMAVKSTVARILTELRGQARPLSGVD